MIKYQGELKDHPFKQMRQWYPTLQKRVYTALLAMTPAQLQFEFSLIPNKESHKFSGTGVDQDTYAIIGTVMSSVLDEQRLILTRDDVAVVYLRMRELMFLYEAVRQGILVEQVTDNSTEYYFDVADPPEEIKEPKRYRRRLQHYRQTGSNTE